MKTRMIVSALATGLICLASTSNASALDLFKFGGGGGCGCEVSSCCDPCAGSSRQSLRSRLSGMFSRKSSCCEAAPACFEPAGPSCGMDASCGCDPCGDVCAPKPCRRPLFGHRFAKLLKRGRTCGSSCGCDVEPTCGCGVVEPTCGCGMVAAEPTCGCGNVEPSCGCGMPEPSCGCDPCAPKRRGLRINLDFRGMFKGLRRSSCGGCGGCGDCGCGVEPACGC